MSPRQARRERREAQRKTRKAELKRMKAACHIPPEQSRNQRERSAAPLLPELSEATVIGFVSQSQNPDRQEGESRSAEHVPNSLGFVSQPSQSRRETNRANAQQHRPALNNRKVGFVS
jgi:hypothetical protein